MAAVTNEQIQKARSVSLLDYMEAVDPSAIRRVGKRCIHALHDSFVIDNGKDGRWYWNSKADGGRAYA